MVVTVFLYHEYSETTSAIKVKKIIEACVKQGHIFLS